MSNCVPDEKGVSLRWLLQMAFGRWSVECCFHMAKDELGMDRYEVRGWRCLYRHFYLPRRVTCSAIGCVTNTTRRAGSSPIV